MPYTVSLLAIILGYTWLLNAFVRLRGSWGVVPTLLALAVVIAHNLKTRDWGFSPRAFAGAFSLAVILTAPIALALWAIGHTIGPAPVRPRPWLDFLYLIFWGGAQQLALQTVVLCETRQLSKRAGVPLAAAIFAALHLPNPFLTVVTFIGGLTWCWIYSRYPNIIPLALSHAASTVVILLSFDPRITGGLRTGWAFFD